LSDSKEFNYSSIDTAYRCYQKYKYIYVDKIVPERAEGGDLHFGSAMHAGLQDLLEGGDGTQVFSVYWDSLIGKDVAYGRYNHSDLSKMGPVFLERFKRLHLKHIKPHAIEQKLQGKLGEFGMYGTPDVVGEFKGIPSIIDFKTSKYAYPNDKILVNEQMYLYAHLAKVALQYEAKQLVYLVFCKQEMRIQTIEMQLDSDKLKVMLDNLELMCHDLTDRQAFPKNRNSCMMGEFKCEFFSKCYGVK
jgi:hypothetical protein